MQGLVQDKELMISDFLSSIDAENMVYTHPSVMMAAVIGVPYPKWEERPVLYVVKKAGSQIKPDELCEFLETRMAKWWLPDRIELVSEPPMTATGRIPKTTLREQWTESSQRL